MHGWVKWLDRPWGRRIVTVTLVSIILSSTVMLLLLWRHDHLGPLDTAERYADIRGDGGELPKLWRAPSFSFVDQHNQVVTLDAMRGEPFVADFVYTQCTSACPMLTSKMVLLQRSLGGVGVRFVSFSVDPAHDTPDALAAYARRWNEHEARWTLLSTGDKTLAAVTDGFRVVAKKTDDDTNPILHSSLFFLVDGEGFVRGVYPSDPTDAMTRIAADVRRLAMPASSDAGPSSDLDKDLYTALGCAGCHDDPRLAPPLVNLVGAERMLASGAKVTIDDAYLRRSILDPGADVVMGYAPTMPSYRHPLDGAELDALVAELDRRTAAAGAETQVIVPLVTDPVCKMKVRAEDASPHVTYDGAFVYFCSEMCRAAFMKN
jgi:protein SCO1/2